MSSARKRHLRAIMTLESTLLRLPKTSNMVISFSDLDFKGIDQNLHDPTVVVGNYIIWKVLVDQGSSTDILYDSTLQKMHLPESNPSSYNGDLVGFFGEWVNVLGVIELRTNFGIESNIKTIDV